MSLHSTLPATWLLGLSLLIAPRATSGQVPASDSTSTGASPASSDTVLPQAQPDSVSKTDSTRAASDTVHPPGAGKATTSDTTNPPTAPSDSILRAACSGPAGSAPVARDLLVVVFAPETGAAERTAAVKSVDGTLLGPLTTGEPGAYYVRVPSGGGGEEYRLRAAADRLIQLDMVRQVGSRACPPLPPPNQARPNSP
jgi:hypothetical protein